jgi:transcription antitermination factor NusG
MSEPNGGKGQSDVPGLRVDGEVCGKCRFVSIKAAACLPAANGGDFFKSTGQPTAIAGDEGKIMNLSGLGSCWFAIQVRPKYEDLTSALLQQKGYEGFVPRLAYTRPSAGLEAGGRNRHRRLLYPGYIFCRFDPVIAAPIVTTPGVIRVCGCGRTPIPISEQEIINIRLITNTGIAVYPWPFIDVGTWVEIVDGPLRGSRGILIRRRSVDRLVVSIDILHRSTAAELDASWVSSARQWNPGSNSQMSMRPFAATEMANPQTFTKLMGNTMSLPHSEH